MTFCLLKKLMRYHFYKLWKVCLIWPKVTGYFYLPYVQRNSDKKRENVQFETDLGILKGQPSLFGRIQRLWCRLRIWEGRLSLFKIKIPCQFEPNLMSSSWCLARKVLSLMKVRIPCQFEPNSCLKSSASSDGGLGSNMSFIAASLMLRDGHSKWQGRAQWNFDFNRMFR